MLVSVIIPCYNEEAVLEATHRRLVNVLEQLNDISFELIYVDDGSTDKTPVILRDLLAANRNARALRLSRNFGHQIALTAGLEHASGDAVIIIDADLQDPPELMLDMIARWREGFHMAYGVRTDRVGETPFKVWSASAFYNLLARLSELKIPREAGDFRLMDRKVVEALLAMPERDRFMRGMASWAGFKQVGVPYSRAPRAAGASKYSVKKMLHFALDGVTSFSLAPLRLAAWTGLIVTGLAIIVTLITLSLWLFTEVAVPGWSPVLITVLLLGGIQLIYMGIVGEYIGRIYGEAKRRPLYLLEERLGFEDKDREANHSSSNSSSSNHSSSSAARQ